MLREVKFVYEVPDYAEFPDESADHECDLIEAIAAAHGCECTENDPEDHPCKAGFWYASAGPVPYEEEG